MNDLLKNEKTEFESEKNHEEEENLRKQKKQSADKFLSSFISDENIVGDLLSLNYNDAIVLVHDALRQKVGGLPMGCFLLASRLKPEGLADVNHEDTALIFLRVTGGISLANHARTEEYRLAAAFRSIDTKEEWDSGNKTDAFTLHELRHAGIKCSVLGTFRMQEHNESWELTFGADISNFYSGQGMKIYKPMGESLEKIVNHTKPTGKRNDLAGRLVNIGRVRYSSSETQESKQTPVQVELEPTDLLARRTALFGMSRSGKSNTIKIIASSVYKLRENNEKGRIGQLIFDINGEYCNKNPQDMGCLRDIWDDTKDCKEEDVMTYGWTKSLRDPNRHILKLNFLGDEPKKWDDRESVSVAMETLIAGKATINNHLSLIGETAKFVERFMDTNLDVPSSKWKNYGVRIRYKRSIIVYRSLLAKAGFETKSNEVFIKGLFSGDFCKAFEKESVSSANILKEDFASWDELWQAFSDLQKFISGTDFKEFDANEMLKKRKKKGSEGEDEEITSWADDTLMGILSLYEHGPSRVLSRLLPLKEQHSTQSGSDDYSVVITQSVRAGKLVIVDCSTGPERSLDAIINRIMRALFNAQQRDFVKYQQDDKQDIEPLCHVVVYIEEAHNILPKTGNLTGIWPRVAKEGSKFHIGMVYSTQEPSSIMSNILKNTDNWFVAHLNNGDEVKELAKYYDFKEFIDQILKVPDTGFLRMRCLSNPYIVPVQVKEFKVSSLSSSQKPTTPTKEEKQ